MLSGAALAGVRTMDVRPRSLRLTAIEDHVVQAGLVDDGGLLLTVERVGDRNSISVILVQALCNQLLRSA